MAFALKKSSSDEGGPKKGPLARLLGKKTNHESNGELPEVDVTAGVNRALRGATNTINTKSSEKDTESIVRVALLAIEAALYTIDLIRDILEQACEVAVSAKSVKDVGGRALLAERYDELRLSINDVLENIDPSAAQLVGQAPRHLDVWLGGKARYSVSSTRLDVSESGLNISPPRNAFSTFEEIDEALKELDSGLARADRAAASYCRDAQYLIARMKGEFNE
ncbi:MAG: hypothetical protein JKX88_01310 [Marinicaulis sp.]|nr:hypothetical protein [Marinicaulis sp.]